MDGRLRVRFIILESVPSLAPSPWGAIFDLSGSPAAFSKSHPAPNAGLYTFIVPSPAGADVSAGDSWFTSRVKANGAVNVVGLLADGTPIVYNWALAGDASLPLYESLLKGKGVFAGDLTFVPNANDPAASDVAGTVVWQKPATAAGPGFTAEGNILGSRFTPPDPTHTVFNSIPGNILLHFTEFDDG